MDASPDPAQGAALQRLPAVLAGRWRLALAVALCTATLAALAAWLLPERYTATTVVVVPPRTSDPIAGLPLPGGVATNHVSTQADVFRSERVMLRAIEAMRLADDPAWLARWREATDGRVEMRPWLAARLARDADVSPSRDSSVLTLNFTWSDPRFAAAMADALTRAYIDTTVEMRLEPARQYSAFFEERTRALRAALEQAQARLSEHERSTGLLVSDERLDVENARLADLSSQIVAAQARAAEAAGRERQAAGGAGDVREVLEDPVVVSLREETSRLELQRRELGTRLGDAHPDVVRTAARLDEARSRLESARRRASAGLGASARVVQSQLRTLQAALDEQRGRVAEMRAARDRAAVLQRDVDSARRAYDAVLARANQTALESRDPQPEVSLLKSASVPTRPSSPKPLPLLAAGLAGGALIGALAALLAELRDRRLRVVRDVAAALRQPLLGIVPSSTPARGTGTALRRLAGLRR
ncbi:MAG TPA: Wzz/FepE/Etk N-terminal domain-containing protein [Burkholderiaceae bacterium]|nr:Wzz/FepE/Etk N-terminal domain-containing protein [Burkholderiaceae bacterium]